MLMHISSAALFSVPLSVMICEATGADASVGGRRDTAPQPRLPRPAHLPAHLAAAAAALLQRLVHATQRERWVGGGAGQQRFHATRAGPARAELAGARGGAAQLLQLRLRQPRQLLLVPPRLLGCSQHPSPCVWQEQGRRQQQQHAARSI